MINKKRNPAAETAYEREIKSAVLGKAVKAPKHGCRKGKVSATGSGRLPERLRVSPRDETDYTTAGAAAINGSGA